jgi:hypothetical protein
MIRRRHQLDCPIGRRTVIVFPVSGAEIDGAGGCLHSRTAQARQKFPKAHIAPMLDQQATGKSVVPGSSAVRAGTKASRTDDATVLRYRRSDLTTHAL